MGRNLSWELNFVAVAMEISSQMFSSSDCMYFILSLFAVGDSFTN